jgi:hypothetical protein
MTLPANSFLKPLADAGPAEGGAWIPAPRTVEELRIRQALLDELAVKTLAQEREMTTRALGDALAVSGPVAEDLFQRLRKAQTVEVTGLSGPTHRMTLTQGGRARAEEILSRSQYVGRLPVSLDEYTERMRSQTVAAAEVRPEQVRDAYASMVLDETIVRQVGIAVASGAAIVLSGPSGTGKTSVAERVPRVFGRGVFVPYAVEVAGEIITVFDPGVHRPLGDAPPHDHDRRWVYCERPYVIAGGELTAEMLDLQYNAVSGFYAAPPQMKANAGVFVIDDFGRQRMRPEELLNRWIVPLDRGVDYLTLHGGNKFAIPFAVLVIFSTNLDPSTGFAADGTPGISDAAFLRRIPNKIAVGYASREDFHEVFRRVCAESGLTYSAPLVDRLIEFLTTQIREPLRPSIPRDIVRQIVWEARYDGVAPEFTPAAMARACRTYFAGSFAGPSSAA